MIGEPELCIYCRREKPRKCICPSGKHPTMAELLEIAKITAEFMCWTPELSPTNDHANWLMNQLLNKLEAAGYEVG